MLIRDGNYGTEFVTIDVGTEKKGFHIHRDLITAESLYFTAAFNGEFCEAAEKRIYLEDTSIDTFMDFMDWLYFGKLSETNQYYDD